MGQNLYWAATGDWSWPVVRKRWEDNAFWALEAFGNSVLRTVISLEQVVLGSETVLNLLDAEERANIYEVAVTLSGPAYVCLPDGATC